MSDDLGRIEEKLSNQAEDVEALLMKDEAAIAMQETAQQAEASETLKVIFEDANNNPLAARIKQQDKKTLEECRVRIKKTEHEKVDRRLIPLQDLKDTAERFSKRNQEFKAPILQLLADKVKDCKTKEDVLKVLSQFYADPTIADDALEFLMEVTTGDLNAMVREAKETHVAERGREIQAGRNIQEEVMKASGQKLGTPTSLRDLYREITGNPREPVALFIELSDRYAYKDMRKVLAFLFHSLGTDLKSQGPSIAPGMLFRLLSEVRSLQAILGVYQFFKQRMNLVTSLFQKNSIEVPKQLNFENISRQFVTLLQERYPTGDKVLQTAGKLGIEKWILAKIIIFSQLRDAIREVALHQLYRSVEHRNEIHNAILEALEALEEELDELLNEDEEEGDQQKKKKDKDKE